MSTREGTGVERTASSSLPLWPLSLWLSKVKSSVCLGGTPVRNEGEGAGEGHQWEMIIEQKR